MTTDTLPDLADLTALYELLRGPLLDREWRAVVPLQREPRSPSPFWPAGDKRDERWPR